jgi:Fic family protein
VRIRGLNRLFFNKVEWKVNMEYQIPKSDLNPEIAENLKNIEKVIDQLNQRRDKGLSPELAMKLKKQLLISHVYHSNAIEGNKLSLRETELILEGMTINERPLKDEIEARSLANATEYLYKLIDGREPLTKRTLLELHGLVMKDIPGINSGQFRAIDVKIKDSEHTPPDFLEVDGHVDKLFQWMNRNSHKFNPLIMGAIIHHWMTWIHPFADGNGRVARMFLNFYLLQKGYPEIIIKITDRDNYYNSLIKADNGDICDLIELHADNIRESINIYEELLNEDERQKAWKLKYKELSESQYKQAKETYAFQYEVWKNQVSVFKALLLENVKDISGYLPHLSFSVKEYDILSFSQYLDILEDRKVSNTWYISLVIYDKNKHDGMGFIFYFERFKYSRPLSILSTKSEDKSSQKISIESKPQIKLYVTARKNQQSQNLKGEIDLINIGTWGDQLSFGLRNTKKGFGRFNKRANVITVKENPGKIVRMFIDQILKYYFSVDARTK